MHSSCPIQRGRSIPELRTARSHTIRRRGLVAPSAEARTSRTTPVRGGVGQEAAEHHEGRSGADDHRGARAPTRPCCQTVPWMSARPSSAQLATTGLYALAGALLGAALSTPWLALAVWLALAAYTVALARTRSSLAAAAPRASYLDNRGPHRVTVPRSPSLVSPRAASTRRSRRRCGARRLTPRSTWCYAGWSWPRCKPRTPGGG